MIKKSARNAIKGVGSGVTYRFKKHLGMHQYPTFLVYQLTNNCNARCQMCSIWKKQSEKEMNIAEISKIFSKNQFSRLRWVNLTGGEPFIRKDVVSVVKTLSGLPRLEGIAIPSNGFLTAKIMKETIEMLKTLKKGQFLSVTLSIDGFEETHDDIRGVSGAYRKVMKTLDKLLELQKKNPNFNVGVQPTISKRNLDEIEHFYEQMRKKASIGFAVMLTSEGYYGNTKSPIALDKEDKKIVAEFLTKVQKNEPQYSFYYSKLIEMFTTGRRNFGCLAGHKTLYMDPYGNTNVCPVLSSDKYSFGQAGKDWFTEDGARVRKALLTEPLCRECSMMCDFINFAKVEFIEHATFMLQHPKVMKRLFQKIKQGNPYF